MLVSPVVLMLCVGVGTRTHVDNFEQIGYPDWLQKRMLAYAPFVEEYETKCQSNALAADPNAVREMAKTWVRAVEDGTLKPLPSVDDSDCMREGIKSQISRVVDNVSAALSLMGRQNLATGHPRRAADDLTLGMELAQTLKYYDLYTVGEMSLRQRHLILAIGSVLPKLDQPARTRMERRLHALRRSDQKITSLIVRARQLSNIELARKGAKKTYIEDVSKIVYAGNLIHEAGERTKITRALKELNVAYSGEFPPAYWTEARYAWTSQAAQTAELDALLASIGKKTEGSAARPAAESRSPDEARR